MGCDFVISGGIITKIKDINKYIIRYLLLSAALALGVIYFDVIIGASKKLFEIVSPLLFGFVIAYVLNIPMKMIERLYFPKSENMFVLKSRKSVGLLLSIIVILLVLAAVTNIVLPQIIASFSIIDEAFQKFTEMVVTLANENAYQVPVVSELIKGVDIDWGNMAFNVVGYLKIGGDIFSSSVGIVLMLVSSVFNIVMSSIFAVYLLLGKDTLIGQLKRLQQAYMKNEHAQKLNKSLAVVNDTFSSFITGQFTEAVIIGALCTVGMWALGLPYAATIGVIVGVTALIPILGAYVGAGIGAFLILMANPIAAFWFLVFIIVLQQIESNLIYPKVVGTSIGLPGMWVIAAVLVGGGLGGVVGMLLGVPFVAAIYKLLQANVRDKLKREQAN